MEFFGATRREGGIRTRIRPTSCRSKKMLIDSSCIPCPRFGFFRSSSRMANESKSSTCRTVAKLNWRRERATDCPVIGLSHQPRVRRLFGVLISETAIWDSMEVKNAVVLHLIANRRETNVCRDSNFTRLDASVGITDASLRWGKTRSGDAIAISKLVTVTCVGVSLRR